MIDARSDELPEIYGHDKHSELLAMITEDMAEGRLAGSGLEPATTALRLAREARERCGDCRDFDEPLPPQIEPPELDFGL